MSTSYSASISTPYLTRSLLTFFDTRLPPHIAPCGFPLLTFLRIRHIRRLSVFYEWVPFSPVSPSLNLACIPFFVHARSPHSQRGNSGVFDRTRYSIFLLSSCNFFQHYNRLYSFPEFSVSTGRALQAENLPSPLPFLTDAVLLRSDRDLQSLPSLGICKFFVVRRAVGVLLLHLS